MGSVAFADLTGQRFGLQTVTRYLGKDPRHQRQWECLCDCGKIVVRRTNVLKRTRSCGCLRGTPSHRKSHTPVFIAWANMIQRTTHAAKPCYRNYSGRGIQVCERWRTFANFYADMGEHPGPEFTLERIDVNGDYEPGNACWATWTDQARNKRNSRLVPFNGALRPLFEVAAALGIHPRTLSGRLDRGWSVERALTTPLKAQYSHPRGKSAQVTSKEAKSMR